MNDTRAHLTVEDVALLGFEKRFENRQPDGSKQTAMWTQLGLTPTSYAQRLNRLLDNPAALAAEPVLINRLRRVRDVGVAARSS